MILLIHNTKYVLNIQGCGINAIAYKGLNISDVLFDLAIKFPNELLIWCNENFEENLAQENLWKIFHHKRIMASYCVTQYFISDEIGFVEGTPFIDIKKDIKYPTWIMSGEVGGIYSETLVVFKNIIKPVANFDYFLSSLAKTGMSQGLLCYSAPGLLNSIKDNAKNKWTKNNKVLYSFISQHYRSRWLFLLLLQQLIYTHRFPILSVIYGLFKSKIKLNTDLCFPKVESSLQAVIIKEVDVIIPTLGRKEYLYDVLVDLKNQTVLPKNVIIIEQNEDSTIPSELNYIKDEVWPFPIRHNLIHITGACNARNLALAKVRTSWVFMADDDIRIPENFIEEGFNFIRQYKPAAFNVGYLQEGEQEKVLDIVQWGSFGSGNSWINATALKGKQFDMGFEHGYGEDTDFGMQLRKDGNDILYNPFLLLTHLKSPIGGFRKKIRFSWDEESVQPKPSPTVMLHALKHFTNYQLLRYKTLLFINFYNKQSIKNPIKYIKSMNSRWRVSKDWAVKLMHTK
ncbi:MAG: glycosyl transferase [Cytophagaceae bacterium]|nr:glycosyl transferase [Cytophagaceae bacterium]